MGVQYVGIGSKHGLAFLADMKCAGVDGAAAAYASNAASAAMAAVAMPFIAYTVQPRIFTAHALSPIESITRTTPSSRSAKGTWVEEPNEGFPELQCVWSVFSPSNILKILAKNIGLHLIIKFNSYMTLLLDNEKEAIDAEARGETAPEPPPLPDFKPTVKTGAWSAARELTVATVRRIYEHIFVWHLPRDLAVAALRDSKAWIKDVLSLTEYFYASLHGSTFYYAAECTVAIGQHAYITYKDKAKSDRAKAAHMVLRCSFVLVAVSAASSCGSVVKPGIGSAICTMAMDYGANMVSAIAIGMYLNY
eukprot:gene19883-26586_t